MHEKLAQPLYLSFFLNLTWRISFLAPIYSLSRILLLRFLHILSQDDSNRESQSRLWGWLHTLQANAN